MSPELPPIEFTTEELKLMQHAVGLMQEDDFPYTRREYAALEDLYQRLDTEIDHRDA